MKRNDVIFQETKDSSVIMGYSWDGSILHIQFVSGKEYEYKWVPAKVIYNLLHCDSVGRFYNKNIKGQYTMERV